MRENRFAETLTLVGEWDLELAGQRGMVRIPGAWEVQGFARDCEGPAVYRRTVDVPASWDGARIILHCEAVSYYVEVFANDQPVGTHEGMWTAFELDVSAAIRPGASNTIELRVIKPGDDGDRFPYRDVIVGFIPYVSITFGGVWGDIWLSAHRSPAWTEVRVAPDWETRRVRLKAQIADLPVGSSLTARVQVCDQAGGVVAETRNPAADVLDVTLAIPDAESWSPKSPVQYRAVLSLLDGDQVIAESERRFGFRQLRADGDQLLLNDEPFHVRGALSWGWDPDTLAPTPTEAQIRDEFARVRALGFNMVKLCLFVPPARLFEIADEEGMLLWLELPMWYQRLNVHLRQQARVEYADILAAVHHHPSIVIYSLGCELGADMADAALLEALNTIARDTLSDVLVCDNSGSGEAYKGYGFDFADFNDYHFYSDLHFFRPLVDHFRRDWRKPRPWIFGEFCDCDDFRDTSAISGDNRPWWREVYGVGSSAVRWAYSLQEERLAALDLPFDEQRLVDVSRSASLLVRKTIIEWTRARRGMGGYVITGLRDTPISTSGVFDDWDQPKYDATAFRESNSDNVLLLEQGRARRWVHGGDRPDPIDLYNHLGGSPVDFRIVMANVDAIPHGMLRWQLEAAAGEVVDSGGWTIPELPAGGLQELGTLEIQMPQVSSAQAMTLRVELAGVASNHWDLWVYPADLSWGTALKLFDPAGALGDFDGLPAEPVIAVPESTDGILIAEALTPDVLSYASRGGRVILLQPAKGQLPAIDVPFWRESIKLIYDHPAWSGFPHQGTVDLQFYSLATNHAINTDVLPQAIPDLRAIKPILRRLDARLFTISDYLVELRVGEGMILASTLRFAGGMGDQVIGLQANVAGRFLLHRLVTYLR